MQLTALSLALFFIFSRSLQFCPDATIPPKLAVAQSDNIVFVYKWGSSKSSDKASNNVWNGKKAICNKFAESSPVQVLVWPANRPHEVTYGLVDGSIKVGNIRTNKSKILFKVNSPVVSLAAHPKGEGVISGHIDGSIYRYIFLSTTKLAGAGCTKIVRHSCPPYALSWGRSVCAAGNDQCVVFYDPSRGTEEQSFSYSNPVEKDDDNQDSENIRPLCCEFAMAAFNPTGDSVIVGNYNSFYSYSYRKDSWEEGYQRVAHMGTVTSLAWEPNGSSIALGTAFGLVDTYNACYRRYTHRNILEVTYVSPSQVLIRRKDEERGASTAEPVVIQSPAGTDIAKLTIHCEPGTDKDRFAIGRTEDELLLCDMDTPGGKISTIHWNNGVTGGSGGNERFIFDSPQACIISHAGELSIVEVSGK
mmetsp:Transcript_24016/g.70857  ORF Transcript_24016/g.70857 Transcript_24016/m.70857 type:complete len:418 (-) Transcript_24016:3228-4481(-)